MENRYKVTKLSSGILISDAFLPDGGRRDFLSYKCAEALVRALQTVGKLYEEGFEGNSTEREFLKQDGLKEMGFEVTAYCSSGVDGTGRGDGNATYRNGSEDEYPFSHRKTEDGLEIGLRGLDRSQDPQCWYNENLISKIKKTLGLFE